MLWKPKTPVRTSVTALAGLGFVLATPAVQLGRAVGPVELFEISSGSAAADGPAVAPMKRYRSAKWNFALDIPASWNAFPPGPAVFPDEVTSPYEVMRFLSSSGGHWSLAIVYRMPRDPAVAPAVTVKQLEASLAKRGFSNFVTGETRFRSRQVLTLNFEKRHPGGEAWRTRSYFFADGTLMYVLGFGAMGGNAKFGLYDQMAKTFTFDASAT
jgi:hypothetical protein